jgi:hypothetical protein
LGELDRAGGTRETLRVEIARSHRNGGFPKGGSLKSPIIFYLILFAVTAAAQVAEDPGPSILSRGVGTLLEAGGTPPTIKPFLSLNGVYDTDLTPVSVDAAGISPTAKSYGGELGFGVLGYKRGRRTTVGIDYRGSFRMYAGHSYYDGSDHTLTLSVTRQLTGRTSLVFRQAAGINSHGLEMGSAYSPFDPGIAGVPANELFDSRTIYLTSMANLIFQKSARLSFSIGGSGNLVRRRSKALAGNSGWNVNGDVSYRISRSISLGADYSYGRTAYTKLFGSSDVHSVGFNVTFRLGRRWDLALRAGAARVAIVNPVRIDFDPVVAAIVGQPFGILVFRSTYFIPSSGAKLSRAFRRSILSLDYGNAPSIGNGVFTTSKSQGVGASYSYTGLRRLNFGLSGGYSTYTSLSENLGKYRSYSGGVGVNYRLKGWLHFSSGYDVRQYGVSQGPFRRLSQRLAIGLSFSPGERPLSLR